MVGSGEEGSKTIRPEFNRSIMIDFQGAKITSDTGFLLLRDSRPFSGYYTEAGLKALEQALTRSNDPLMKRKKKQRLVVDVDSTEDPAHGKQENAAFNGHFGKSCFHPRRAGFRLGWSMSGFRQRTRSGNSTSAARK